ncbi:MAG: hypothetical protein WCN87_02845 [Chlamydiota bacterium]
MTLPSVNSSTALSIHRMPVEPNGYVLGHKVVVISGKGSYIDASNADNQVLFPYKGLHNLRIVQYIAIGIFATLAAIGIATGLILSGAAVISTGLLIGLGVGASIATLGTLLVQAYNQDDPLLKVAERERLLKEARSNPYTAVLTDAEKAALFAVDRQISPSAALTDFYKLSTLNGFNAQRSAVDVPLQGVSQASLDIDQLDSELQTNLAPAIAYTDAQKSAADRRFNTDVQSARIAQTAGMAGMLAGQILIGNNTAGNFIGNAGALVTIGGRVVEENKRAELVGAKRLLDDQLKWLTAQAKQRMGYEGRKANILRIAGPHIIRLQEIASESTPHLNRLLCL